MKTVAPLSVFIGWAVIKLTNNIANIMNRTMFLSTVLFIDAVNVMSYLASLFLYSLINPTQHKTYSINVKGIVLLTFLRSVHLRLLMTYRDKSKQIIPVWKESWNLTIFGVIFRDDNFSGFILKRVTQAKNIVLKDIKWKSKYY